MFLPLVVLLAALCVSRSQVEAAAICVDDGDGSARTRRVAGEQYLLLGSLKLLDGVNHRYGGPHNLTESKVDIQCREG
jgi:hypothetical protein